MQTSIWSNNLSLSCKKTKVDCKLDKSFSSHSLAIRVDQKAYFSLSPTKGCSGSAILETHTGLREWHLIFEPSQTANSTHLCVGTLHQQDKVTLVPILFSLAKVKNQFSFLLLQLHYTTCTGALILLSLSSTINYSSCLENIYLLLVVTERNLLIVKIEAFIETHWWAEAEETGASSKLYTCSKKSHRGIMKHSGWRLSNQNVHKGTGHTTCTRLHFWGWKQDIVISYHKNILSAMN